MPHLATPRKTEHPIAAPGEPRSWSLRSAGGARPALVVWGDAADAALDRLARAGFGVVTPSAGVTPDDLLTLVDQLPQGIFGGTRLSPVGVLLMESAPGAGPGLELEAKGIPWRKGTGSDWDDVVRWFAERLT